MFFKLFYLLFSDYASSVEDGSQDCQLRYCRLLLLFTVYMKLINFAVLCETIASKIQLIFNLKVNATANSTRVMT